MATQIIQSPLALRPREAAKALGISPRLLWQLTHDGRIPCVRVGSGKRRIVLYPTADLQAWLTRLVEALHGRIHGFNVSVAHVWAEQERMLDKVGQRMPIEDSYIAATARRHGLTIATGDDRDFTRPGLKVFNPFKALR